jgi:hypothetical protein
MSLQSMMHPSMQAQLEADLVANSKASGLQLLARSLTRGKDLDTKIQDALSAVSDCHSL